MRITHGLTPRSAEGRWPLLVSVCSSLLPTRSSGRGCLATSLLDLRVKVALLLGLLGYVCVFVDQL